MYLNPEYNRKLSVIKEPPSYNYSGNIFLTKSYEQFIEEQNLKSNYDSVMKEAGLEDLLKTFKVSKSDTEKPEFIVEKQDIENLDQRLYKTELEGFVEARNLAETKEIDFTDSELLRVWMDNKNSENSTKVEDTENTDS